MALFIKATEFSEILRTKGIDLTSRRILITKYDNSKQINDLTLPPNCNGFGRIHHFKRYVAEDWPSNPLPIDPACKALNLQPSDFIQVQLFQNSICSWRCWYCFVDDALLRGDIKYSEFKSTDELLELYLAEKRRVPVIDISGGQPEIVPEWAYWFLKSLYSYNLEKEIYLWSDDSLSNDYLWRYLSKEEIKFMTKAPNYGRVGCFKGFDEHSFSFNSKVDPSFFSRQFTYMKKLVNEGFDVYGYVTFTTDDDTEISNRINSFLDRLQEEIHPVFPLRVVPLKIFRFSPTAYRMQNIHQKALEIQQLVALSWAEELKKRFSKKQLHLPIYMHSLFQTISNPEI